MKRQTVRDRLHRQIVRCRRLVVEYSGLEYVGMDCGVHIRRLVEQAENALFHDNLETMKESLEQLKECE